MRCLSTGPHLWGFMQWQLLVKVPVYGIVKWMLSQDWQLRPLLMVPKPGMRRTSSLLKSLVMGVVFVLITVLHSWR